MKTALQSWTGPVPMDTGAPEPTTLNDGCTLWVAYRARDPEFPGWGQPGTDAYLERHPDGEPFGVLRFDGVVEQHLGGPNEERLREHPLWSQGLSYYSFHRLDTEQEVTRWIVTFHDETLDVTARVATESIMIFATSPLEAIEKARKGT